MSRIQFETKVHGKVFPIAMGWDRRLCQCFLSVSDVNMDDDEYDDPRFDAILDASSAGLSQGMGVERCKTILEGAGVVAPPGAYELLEQHMQVNAGNLVVNLEESGAATVILDEDGVYATSATS
ncbi:hypothetical protein [Ottowia sp.]|uniref:hypothetical protein n=1 Tax=Ottowia sp. TaxID=1898956 RepID=UPI0025F4AB1A|nr:hypothetical protein [Ottowia sp.]MBK6616315.1 hypothetical protein [Ottowia sp.]